MTEKETYINSVNLNSHTDFPYLVLNVENNVSKPHNSGFRVMHWHEDLQFIYVFDGTICIRTLNKEEKLSAREGAFINKNVVHLVEKIGCCRYKSFLFPEFFVSFYIGSPAARLTSNITENKGIDVIALRNSAGWHSEVLQILNELAFIERQKDTFYSYEVLSKLSVLWLVILKNVSPPNDPADNTTSVRMRKFLRYIETYYMEDISLEDMAASANVSKSEILRCFKTTLRTTPYKYLMDYRLQKAAELLTETDMPIGEIASRIGFGQQGYFGKRFKEKMGCSPGEYRDKNKE